MTTLLAALVLDDAARVEGRPCVTAEVKPLRLCLIVVTGPDTAASKSASSSAAHERHSPEVLITGVVAEGLPVLPTNDHLLT